MGAVDVAGGAKPEAQICRDYFVPATPSELQDWAFDPDGLPRAVSAVELEIVTKVKEQSTHSHYKGIPPACPALPQR